MSGESGYFNIIFLYGPKMYIHAALSVVILFRMLRLPEFLDKWHMKVFRSGCPVIYVTLYVTYMCTHFSAVWCVVVVVVVVQNVLSKEV
jgi:hypothetical protein